jgi:hypothetical protein
MRAPLAAVLLAVLGAAAARGQTIDPDKAQAWLENTYGIKTERVAEATPDELVALRTIEPRPPSDFHVIAHFETFTASDPLTPPSSDREYLINCPSRRFHVDRIESFSEHGSRGGQSTTDGPAVWGLPVPNSASWRIIEAVCGPSAQELALEAERPVAPPPPLPRVTPPPVSPPAAAASEPNPALGIRPRIAIQPKPPTPAKPATEARPVRVQLFAGGRGPALAIAAVLPARLRAVPGYRQPEVVEGVSGGRPLYRVQITGFASQADAARFCAAARGLGQDCFVP